MARRIDVDRSRFRQIVRGQIKRNLQRYISKGDFLARRGKDVVSVPVPQIELPRFRFGSNQGSGVGQGEGANGTPIGQDEESSGGPGEAGDTAGEHALDVEMTLEELAEILGEELALPNIQPKGQHEIVSKKAKYTAIRRVGPASLRHFRRTFKEALKRTIASGHYDPDDPHIVPEREDMRYRAWKEDYVPESNAVIIYMMDVSGSMGDEQKEIVRITAFWIDTWLRSQYKRLQVHYIVHDAAAKEVDEHTFYNLRESGGTKISSAYELCSYLLSTKYPTESWNVYPFHFSDGDNWGSEDTERCVKLLTDHLLKVSNLFCYAQVKSAYGSGKFKGELDAAFPKRDNLITADILDRDGILRAIKKFLGTGK